MSKRKKYLPYDDREGNSGRMYVVQAQNPNGKNIAARILPVKNIEEYKKGDPHNDLLVVPDSGRPQLDVNNEGKARNLSRLDKILLFEGDLPESPEREISDFEVSHSGGKAA